jgi:nucleotide-binding universal stress UspA family protein
MTKKMLCPVDFSKGSEGALQKAEELARALGAEIELLHVYQIPVLAMPDAPLTVSPSFVADITDRAERALKPLAERVRAHGLTATTHLTEGVSADVIVRRAQELGAELIVMGTHGYGGFRRFLLGSTAERVVRTSTVPVLTVHVGE